MPSASAIGWPHAATHPRLDRFITEAAAVSPILARLKADLPLAFWKLVPDRYALRTAHMILALNLSRQPQGHVLEDSEAGGDILTPNGRITIPAGVRSFVYRDFTGSLERIFSHLSAEHWEVRFMKNFGSESRQGYALTQVFPKGAVRNMRTRFHGVIEIAEAEIENPRLIEPGDVAELQKHLAEARKFLVEDKAEGETRFNFSCQKDVEEFSRANDDMFNLLLKKGRQEIIGALAKELVLLPPSKIEQLVDDYLQSTLPQIIFVALLNGKPEKLARDIKVFLQMDKQAQRIVVASPTSEDWDEEQAGTKKIKHFNIAIKDERVTPILLKIAEILKKRGIGIRYFLVESLEPPPKKDKAPAPNKTICKIGIQAIDLDAFEAVKVLIEDIARPTFGVKSLLHDIMGPIMVGPSSSHTAGACKIGRLARNIIAAYLKLDPSAEPADIEIEMVRTFSLNNTGQGHYSHIAVRGGLEGIPEGSAELEKVEKPEEMKFFDVTIGGKKIRSRIRSIDQDSAVHDNTIRIKLRLKNGQELVISGASVGGGVIGIQSVNGEAMEYEAENQVVRGNRPLYLLELKEGRTLEDLSAELRGRSIIQLKEFKIGDKRLVLLCLDKEAGELESAKSKEEVARIATTPETAPPEFGSFADILRLAHDRGYSSLSALALDYELRQTPRQGKPDEAVKEELMTEMRKRLEVMFEAVRKGSQTELALKRDEVGDRVEIAQLPRLLTNLLDVPITKDQFRARRTALCNRSRTATDFQTAMEGKGPYESPFEAYTDWAFIAADPAVSQILRETSRTVPGSCDSEGEIDAIYTRIQAAWRNNPLNKNIYSLAMAYAEAVNIYNAGMGLIVAAPTAGAAGVIPGVLAAMEDFYRESYAPDGKKLFTPEKLTQALFTASLIGLVINDKVKTAGGTGGCQAELGAATAMAAGAATELLGGTPEEVVQSVALSLQFMEGLVCDPVGGYVVWPCILRNGLAATVALASAWQARRLRKSMLSADAAIEGLRDVAAKMHYTLREWGRDGGLAGTAEGDKAGQRMKDGCLDCRKC